MKRSTMRGPARPRRQQQHDFGVRGRLADRAFADQLAPQRQAVGEIAVVGDRQAAGVEFGEQRLDVAQDRRAGRRIAHVADRRRAGQALDRRRAGEVVADQAEAALGMEARAVEGDDAGRLLAAVLQSVQAERGDRRGGGMTEDAEDAAFLAQPVAVEIEVRPRAGEAPARGGGGRVGGGEVGRGGLFVHRPSGLAGRRDHRRRGRREAWARPC